MPLILYVSPVLPDAVTVIEPSALAQGVADTGAAATVIFTPLQTFIDATVKEAEPSQPLLFLAVIV